MSNFSAVLVGINKYDGNELNGCVNDVVIMRDILVKKYNVPVDQIRLILDERATKAAIEERLEWLATNDAEQKFFHYSGHGAQIPSRSYNGKTDVEADGMDELICPVDFDWDGTYILDDEINEILNKMSEDHHMTMLFDCCHSGSITRELSDVRPKRIVPPLDILSRDPEVTLTAALGLDLDGAFDEVPTEKLPRSIHDAKQNISVITGCKDNQTSADAYINKRYQGALSYVVQSILMKNTGITLKDLRASAEKQLTEQGFDQTPQLICDSKNLDKPFIQI